MRATLLRLNPLLVLAVCLSAEPASANWLTALERGSIEAGEGASFVTKLGPVGKAAAYLKDLAVAPEGALAAHATPEGHWEFANRDGQTFTVGTPDEMTRVLPALIPDAAARGNGKLTLYLSEDSVFANRDALSQIPADADLFVVTDYGAATPVTRTIAGRESTLTAQLRPHLAMDLDVEELFDEAVFRLNRPLNKSNIRTIAFERGASKRLGSAPKYDGDSKVPLADPLDPDDFGSAFRSAGGQTAIVTGRVGGGRLTVSPSSGADMTFSLEDMINGARANDVNLVVLESDSGRQAGGRNWFWQRIEVGGLSNATNAATFGDFLDVLAAERGGFKLAVTRDSTGRVHITAAPGAGDAGMVEGATDTIKDWVGHVTGEVLTRAVDIDTRDRAQEQEHDTRLIPGVPTPVQIPYLIGLVAAVASWSTVRRWWFRIAPSSLTSGETASLFGKARRVLSEAICVLIFSPLVGLPAFTFQAIHQLITMVLAPFRWFWRRFLVSKV